ncbi:hypothetical protein SAMN05192533_101487 [Mesobacillus persicus]|uniref:Uncharacterized protein n=1 Tax=Mesobacillus persicus TaxID=930146 RepID=A0A1H7WLU8_9BACI|nr:hypothetical protein [Mesobacillus persicus]SEM22344.1 hypothetical protein SAMN05192533_101487 [Mesobacillus persicus]
MKLIKTISTRRLTILISAILLVVGLFFGLQFYFSYLETKTLAEECYDKGGMPELKKSGVKIIYFSCEMDG